MRAWTALSERLAAYETGTTLAVVRILLAAVLLWDLIDIGQSGAMTLVWLPADAGGMRDQLPASGVLADFIETTAPNIRAVYGATIAAAALLLVGIGAQPAALVALLGIKLLAGLNAMAGGGHDRVFANGLFLLMLSRSDVTLSLRCWLRHRRWTSDEPVPAWPRHLLTYQLALLYTMTGIQKLGAVWWPSGGYLAIHYVLLQPHWSRADWWWVAWLGPFTRAATAITWWWESLWFLVPIWVWLRGTPERGGRLRALAARADLRTPFVVLGVLMHGGVAVMMNLGPFSAVTLSLYPALYRPDELERWLRLRSRPGASPRAEEA